MGSLCTPFLNVKLVAITNRHRGVIQVIYLSLAIGYCCRPRLQRSLRTKVTVYNYINLLSHHECRRTLIETLSAVKLDRRTYLFNIIIYIQYYINDVQSYS